ncbi:MAG: hypothetical protein ABS68_01560 [Niastella sp. SCN 39-18]|nr:MAG: hypothetical protein ABS68_01560 [Niastella sp. SCN 39-18]OJW10752.1 MAG: hypothetical protein BGO53_14330 [Sphingobacteriales bacterium 39-19]
MAKVCRIIFITFIISGISLSLNAQVSSVTFGKNRLQFKKMKWQFYQSDNFNVYFYDGGQELAKYALQLAEQELPQIESATEYSLQRRANILVYNNYDDMRQTNVGLDNSVLTEGGVTRLVNNKMVIYFDADHANMKKQIRQGIADIITKNVLFGDDLGEVAGNQTLLDLPEWLTDGYVAYIGENWSTDLDDDLRSEILSGNYNSFKSLSFHRPLLAGHAFWYYIEEKYKKENVTYFLYLARTYKNLNKASQQITKKKFSDVLKDFMEYNEDKYYKDISRRKAYPKGNYIEGFDISKRLNYYRFNVNPNKRSNAYVVTQFKKGIVRVILYDDFEFKTLLKYGIRTYENSMNPNYPMMAWDPKGTRVAVLYSKEGRLKLFVYDLVTRIKNPVLDLTDQFDQVQDIKYMINSGTLLLSAVKNGHTDIYALNLQNEKSRKITDDVYDDIDPTFVSFPHKTGILFSSNRPGATTKGGDTSLPSNNRYNIFLVTDFGDKPELNQITQLSNLKYGNARYPTPYNSSHFTFVSDENGIANRYAGFFTSTKLGLDTLVLIGDDILRNPSAAEVDSTLKVYKKTDVDSIAVVSISADSAYTFPLSNYPSNLAESRIAGENNQVSEVTRQSDEKTLYKLKIDENTLQRRNISAPPTEYAKKRMKESMLTEMKPAILPAGQDEPSLPADSSSKKQETTFQTEFETEENDSTRLQTNPAPSQPLALLPPQAAENPLSKAKLFRYKPLKFSADFGSAAFNSNVLVNRYQPYMYGSGPIMLNSGTVLNGLIKLGTADLMEDIRINGAFKIGTNLKDNEWFLNFQNLKKRIDWGLTYYRNAQSIDYPDTVTFTYLPVRNITNLYQGNISYPFDEARSIRFSTGIRVEKQAFKVIDEYTLGRPDQRQFYSISRLEYIYDNSLNPSMNIWNGLRYKIYGEYNRQLNKNTFTEGASTFNVGFDARYYYPIFRDFIWAGRAAGDFSWGKQKFIYYLGGVDGWLMFGNNQKSDGSYRYFNESVRPANDNSYSFQSLAVNMRGFLQNVANGNNALVINSELRLPVFSTFFDKIPNNSFLRNFQLTQFIDLGTAWNGAYNGIKRPEIVYGNINDPNTVLVKAKAGGIGPFAGGYGFGARSTLLGYFIKFDAGWPMSGFFNSKPILYLALGFDF